MYRYLVMTIRTPEFQASVIDAHYAFLDQLRQQGNSNCLVHLPTSPAAHTSSRQPIWKRRKHWLSAIQCI